MSKIPTESSSAKDAVNAIHVAVIEPIADSDDEKFPEMVTTFLSGQVDKLRAVGEQWVWVRVRV